MWVTTAISTIMGARCMKSSTSFVLLPVFLLTFKDTLCDDDCYCRHPIRTEVELSCINGSGINAMFANPRWWWWWYMCYTNGSTPAWFYCQSRFCFLPYVNNVPLPLNSFFDYCHNQTGCNYTYQLGTRNCAYNSVWYHETTYRCVSPVSQTTSGSIEPTPGQTTEHSPFLSTSATHERANVTLYDVKGHVQNSEYTAAIAGVVCGVGGVTIFAVIVVSIIFYKRKRRLLKQRTSAIVNCQPATKDDGPQQHTYSNVTPCSARPMRHDDKMLKSVSPRNVITETGAIEVGNNTYADIVPSVSQNNNCSHQAENAPCYANVTPASHAMHGRPASTVASDSAAGDDDGAFTLIDNSFYEASKLDENS